MVGLKWCTPTNLAEKNPWLLESIFIICKMTQSLKLQNMTDVDHTKVNLVHVWVDVTLTYANLVFSIQPQCIGNLHSRSSFTFQHFIFLAFKSVQMRWCLQFVILCQDPYMMHFCTCTTMFEAPFCFWSGYRAHYTPSGKKKKDLCRVKPFECLHMPIVSAFLFQANMTYKILIRQLKAVIIELYMVKALRLRTDPF